MRRYDMNDRKTLTYEEAKEWVYCFAPYLDENVDFDKGCNYFSWVKIQQKIFRPKPSVSARTVRGYSFLWVVQWH